MTKASDRAPSKPHATRRAVGPTQSAISAMIIMCRRVSNRVTLLLSLHGSAQFYRYLKAQSRCHSVGLQLCCYLPWRGALGKEMPAVQVGHVPDPLLHLLLVLPDADVVLAVTWDEPLPYRIHPHCSVCLVLHPIVLRDQANARVGDEIYEGAREGQRAAHVHGGLELGGGALGGAQGQGLDQC
jgi:hypothetical protein